MKQVGLVLEESLAPLFYSEKGRYAGIAVLALACLLFLYTMGEMLVTWYGDVGLTQQATVKAPQENAMNRVEVQIDQIPAAHLFGQAADDEFMPITSLQVRLTGIMQMPDSQQSRAIISQGGAPGKVYRIGDEVVSNIKIYAINSDNIVLERNAHLEKLPLARSSLQFQDKPAPLWQENNAEANERE